MEEALLLPKDMSELRNIRKNEVFLNCKRYLDMAVQATFRLEEITNSCYQQLEDERKRRIAAMQTLTIAENSNAELKKKLADKEHTHQSADSALEGTQRQVEDQRKRLRETTDQLTASREQMAALKKQLEEAQRLKDQAEKSKAEAEKAKIEAEKARDKAEQKGYDLGVVETKETLRAKVPAVCRIYCAQTWDEALNRAGVEASSELRKSENIFYPPAIRASDLPSTQGEVASIVADPIKEAQPQDPPFPSQQWPRKEPGAQQEVPLDKATAVLEVGAALQGLQQDLALTTMPAEGASKDKEGTTTTEADNPANKNSKFQIKLKK
ncbi:uncharacterized protein LOC126700620 [Quercus robur]|uniref:uncharacterized protein LOC126700620 n=1 Tax=Quercus robur TaxID=38942 RepID=UPI002161D9BA|nr:uncharacterized protein LOC126700620 [Quercus robur]